MEKYILVQIIIIMFVIIKWIIYQKGNIKIIKWKDTDKKVYAISIYISKGYRYAIFSKMSQIDFLELVKLLENSARKYRYTYGDVSWTFGKIQKKFFLKCAEKYKNQMIERGWKASSDLSQKEIDKAYRYVAAHIQSSF